MLSILIPIYNYNAYNLAHELNEQCVNCGIEYEIICQDDASNSILNTLNEEINQLPNCSFISLKQNVAHRQNRNLLAEKAKYKWLLFIDGDSKINQQNYIQNYIDNTKDFEVIYGGRIHSEVCPSDEQKLRWKYGKFIEDKTATERLKNPYKCLLFNNTLILKSEFNKVKFDPEITLYGHDDTQFSYELSKIKSKVNHIENPILHDDIDESKKYLNKTEESLKSLLILFASKKISPEFVSILKLYVFLKNTGSIYIVRLGFKLFKNIFRKQILSSNPSLGIFNAYRIGYLCSLKE
ncbi:glycosyltransferase family 2 protein [Flavobacterium sp.]|jgi:glycosyltransferase involved in cell wall biosynthesis|uniref:glycosyltransferase family 2 protein n=1 Tax=Flavobacterium sp. TaxID=239 RepID=UPI002A824CAD|nr:glycosyltransferase family 2 protein [Flavobacterium sp.]